MKHWKIWIDAGHGGHDSGAAFNGLFEKNINLNVAKKLAYLLINNGYEIGMTRMYDAFVSLKGRCDAANKGKYDLFIAVHHNAGKGDGFEAIHSIHHGDGEILAKMIATEFSAIGQNPHGTHAVYDREGKDNKDYYYVIKHTNMPAVISEFAFLDTKDHEQIDDEFEQEAEAHALFIAIKKYTEQADKFPYGVG